MAVSSWGAPGASTSGSGTAPERTWASTAAPVSPMKAGLPTRISNRIVPSAQTSEPSDAPSPRACSGLMVAGVPMMAPGWVVRALPLEGSRGVQRSLASLVGQASPQSATWVSPNSPTSTLSGLRSRWMMPLEWA